MQNRIAHVMHSALTKSHSTTGPKIVGGFGMDNGEITAGKDRMPIGVAAAPDSGRAQGEWGGHHGGEAAERPYGERRGGSPMRLDSPLLQEKLGCTHFQTVHSTRTSLMRPERMKQGRAAGAASGAGVHPPLAAPLAESCDTIDPNQRIYTP